MKFKINDKVKIVKSNKKTDLDSNFYNKTGVVSYHYGGSTEIYDVKINNYDDCCAVSEYNLELIKSNDWNQEHLS